MTELYGLDPRRSTSLQSIHPYSPSSLSSSLRKEGIGVFYRGLGVAMMRAAPTAAVTLSLFDVLQGQGLKVAGIGG